MSDNSSIEWTDATWSPLRARRKDNGKVGQHCERVSPGCTFCYAARHNGRNLPNGGTGLDYVRGSRDLVETFVDEKVITQPLRWKQPRKIFVCNQTDLFAGFYTDEMRARVFAVMAAAPHHTFQVLTKRPARARDFMLAWDRGDRSTSALFGSRFPLTNVWLGVTAEDQQRADERIPILLDTPAAVRFVSAEPLLGPIRFLLRRDATSTHDVLAGEVSWAGLGLRGGEAMQTKSVDWVIVGGESGPGARECKVEWIRSIVDQCREAGTSVFVKQLGALPTWEQCGLVANNPPKHRDAYLNRQFVRRIVTSDKKGGMLEDMPADLRVREFPRESVRA